MSKFQKHFIAASLTATMAFNSLAVAQTVDPAENTLDSKPPIPQKYYDLVLDELNQYSDDEREEIMSQPEFQDILDEIAYERFYYSSEQIQERLGAVTDRQSFYVFMEDLKNSPYYENIKDNIDSPDSLESVLDNTKASPLLAIPLLLESGYGNSYPNLNLQTMNVLMSAGADINTIDKAFLIRTRDRAHVFDFVDRNIQEKLDQSYIKYDREIQTNGYEGNLPQSLLDSISDDLNLTRDLRSRLGHEANVSLEDVAPLNYAYNGDATNEALQNQITALREDSYKQSLLVRNRQYTPENAITAQTLEESYGHTGYNIDAGINYQFDDIELPTQHANFTLIVTEAQNDIHSDTTHRYAEALAVRISPDYEGDQDVVFAGAQNILEENDELIRMASIGAGHIILSKSYAPYTENVYNINTYILETSVSSDLEYNFHDNNGTLQFVAAGNDFDGVKLNVDTKQDTIGSFAYAAHNSMPAAHANNSVIVGAAHIQDGTTFMSTYSSMGADFLMETPDFYGAKINGTSFSTPIAAEYYHQIAESYGDTLTHDEIMFAALYSTQTDIYNVNLFDIEKGATEIPEASSKDEVLSLLSQINEKEYHKEVIETFPKTVFRTNDAGIPFHERAGAGFLNVDTWMQNLEDMAKIKSRFEHEAEEIIQKDKLSALEDANYESTDNFNYRYIVNVNEDMTLDKQTLYMGQSGLNSVRITSPSGMQVDFVGSATGYISTRGFSGEDVKAGQQIIIETTEELGEHAAFTLRGYEDGNIMQAFREHKMATNALQANSVYEGDKLSENPEAALAQLNITAIQDRLSEEMNTDIRRAPVKDGPYIP